MAVFPGQQGGPLVHIVAAKAVAFGEVLRPEFKTYAAQIVANAKVLGEALRAEGFRLVSGGTDNHLLLVDVFEKGILGSEAEVALGKAGITVNKNAIPYDTNPPLKPSGIRIGTPALTTRGMKEAEMRTDCDVDCAGAGAEERRWGAGADSRRSGGAGESVSAVCVAAQEQFGVRCSQFVEPHVVRDRKARRPKASALFCFSGRISREGRLRLFEYACFRENAEVGCIRHAVVDRFEDKVVVVADGLS